jgi:hypothetical protein
MKPDRQCTYDVTLRRVFQNHCYCGKAVSVTYWSVCACFRVRACGYAGAWACAWSYVHIGVLIQHATRMRHVVTSFVAPLSLHYVFRQYLINGTIFGKKVIGYKMCVLIFSTAFVYEISHSKNNLARYHKNVETLSCKVRVIFIGF